MRQTSLTALALSCMLMAGCGTGVTPRPMVKGTLTYKGQPLANRTLILSFVAPQGESFSHNIPIDDQGRFQGEVSKPGNYKVVVGDALAAMEAAGGEADGKKPQPKGKGGDFPAKYRAPNTSDLIWQIDPGVNQRAIDLPD